MSGPLKDNRLKIGVDVDDVLADFIGTFRLICQEVTGRELPERPNTWMWDNWNLKPEELEAGWKKVQQTYNFHTTLKSCADLEGFDFYEFSQKHRLFYITTRYPNHGDPVEIQTAQWLHWYFNQEFPTVIVTPNKGAVAKALNLDVFIDDRAKNLLDVYNDTILAGQPIRLFLRDREHNRNVDSELPPAYAYTRVESFKEFADSVETSVAV